MAVDKHILTIWPFYKNNGEQFPSYNSSFMNEEEAMKEAMDYKKVYPNGRIRVEKIETKNLYDSLTSE